MSPEEEVAVAEPEAAPTPPEPPEPVPEAQEPEAVAAGEPDGAPEGEAPESGAPEDEGLSVDDQIVQALSTIAKDNPDAFDKAIDALPEEMQEKYRGSAGERAALEAEKAQSTRATTVQSAQAAYQPYSAPVDTTEWRRAGEDIARQAKESVRKAIQEGKEDVDVLPANFADQLADLAEYGNSVRTSQQGYLGALYQNALLTKLEGHQAHRFLTSEDKESLQSMSGVDAIGVYLDAAIRAAPKAIKEAAKAEADETLKNAGVLEKLQNIAGGNGRKATTAGSAPSGQPKNEQEARAWHASGKWTNEQMRAYLARR